MISGILANFLLHRGKSLSTCQTCSGPKISVTGWQVHNYVRIKSCSVKRYTAFIYLHKDFFFLGRIEGEGHCIGAARMSSVKCHW